MCPNSTFLFVHVYACLCVPALPHCEQSTLVCNNVCACHLKALMASFLTNCFCLLQTTRQIKKPTTVQQSTRGTFTRACWDPFREAALSMLRQRCRRFPFEAHSVAANTRLEPWGQVYTYTGAQVTDDIVAAGVYTVNHEDFSSSRL